VARRGRPLDLSGPALASDPLIGEHDFASFCRRPKVGGGRSPPGTRRSGRSARWDEVGADRRLLRFEITANAFCHQMVRSIVGTLVEVGPGKRSAGSTQGTLRARDRATAGQLAPHRTASACGTRWEMNPV
jgi:tRNA pseudouridine38-40 synthase